MTRSLDIIGTARSQYRFLVMDDASTLRRAVKNPEPAASEKDMAKLESVRFNGRTEDEVEKKYVQWHHGSGRGVHIVKMQPIERLHSGLEAPPTPATP